MQHEANEKLLKQSEEHRVLAQKQFTDSMARMQANHESVRYCIPYYPVLVSYYTIALQHVSFYCIAPVLFHASCIMIGYY